MTATAPQFLAPLVGVGGILFGALFIWIGLHLRRDGRELRRNGATVATAVQRKLHKAGNSFRGGLADYCIGWLFAGEDGKPCEVALKVQSREWRRMTLAGEVKLTWLPGQLDSVNKRPLWGHKARGLIGVVPMAMGGISAVVCHIGGLWEFLRDENCCA